MDMIVNRKGQPIEVAKLFASNQKINFEATDKEKDTVFHLAATFGQSQLFSEMLVCLLERGIGLSDRVLKMKNKNGDDPLALAIQAKSNTCISSLIKFANFKITNDHLFLSKKINSQAYTYLKKKKSQQENPTSTKKETPHRKDTISPVPDERGEAAYPEEAKVDNAEMAMMEKENEQLL